MERFAKLFIIIFCFWLSLAQEAEGQLAFLKDGRFDYFELFEELDPIQTKLLSEEESIQPGRPFWLGLRLDIADGWHSYWKNPGDLGLANKVEWKLPSGFEVESLQWPFPKRFVTDDFVNFGYQNFVLLLARVIPPENLVAENNVTLSADVHWFACKDKCIPGMTPVSLTLPVKADRPLMNRLAAEEFSHARKQLPQQAWQVKAERQGDELLLKMNSLGSKENLGVLQNLFFFPENEGLVDLRLPQSFERTSEGYSLTLKLSQNIEQEKSRRLKGVLVSSEGWKGDGTEGALEIDVPLKGSWIPASIVARKASPVPNVSPPASVQEFKDPVFHLTHVLFFAFLGGLLLNLMPCVFPVIALKVLGFIQLAGESRVRLILHGFIFSLGVFLSFWALGGLFFLLRLGGESIGWGFQMQEPIFVACLICLFVLCALGLFDVFQVSMLSLPTSSSTQKKSPLWATLISGVVATAVATPCIGPFLGPVLGATVSLNFLQSFLVYTCIALGLSTPYLLFSVFPGLIRVLPKPGSWMLAFKQVMGFFMLTAAVWLVWVFTAQTSNDATLALTLGLLCMSFAAWVYGKWGSNIHTKRSRGFAIFVALIFLFLGGVLAWRASKEEGLLLASSGEIDQTNYSSWEAFSPEKLEAYRLQGVPVFIDFTASWCLICQGNKPALYSSRVQKELEKRGVVKMRADWTKHDPVITEELEKYGRVGVPLYLLFGSDSSKPPMILPQLLTREIILEHLQKLK